MDLIEKAFLLALEAHPGQLRKDHPLPYIVHPVSVSILLAKYGFSDEVIAAALVHDVAEDTDVSLEQLSAALGKAVVELVAPITHDASLSWEDKKRAYIESVRFSSDEAKAIATADKIANAESLLEAYKQQGQKVWEYFNAGRDKKIWFEQSMLQMLQETWQHPLVEAYASYVARLEQLV